MALIAVVFPGLTIDSNFFGDFIDTLAERYKDERVDAIVVPRAAIYQNATGDTVVRVVDVNTGVQTEVIIETGIQEGSFTEVVSGLAGGEKIVVEVSGG